MEFIDEYDNSRPKLVFQAKQLDSESLPSPSLSSIIHKPTLLICVSLAILFAYLAIVFIDSEPFRSLLLWLSLSLLVGPFAPRSVTAGDIRVGLGPCLREIPKAADPGTDEKLHRKLTKPVRNPSEDAVRSDGFLDKSTYSNEFWIDSERNQPNANGSLTKQSCEGKEWSRADEELLLKLMGKHPAAMPGRWELIAEGFQGRHRVENVIMKGKEMGVRNTSDRDPFKKFLEDRKPVDKVARDVAKNNAGDVNGTIKVNVEEDQKETGWSAAEDLALLNALKEFPKDVALRWEKVAASLPGKSKSACMKRVTELKKDFRSQKTSSDQAS